MWPLFFTGGASLALAAVGLAVMVADEIVKSGDGGVVYSNGAGPEL
ncbi:hypothetical protein KCP77_07235 [Salmonella enterica subsp. enterica]|nr:hypothetical protein KCP77_07235 [Salmonella enterica subsp. enterica]